MAPVGGRNFRKYTIFSTVLVVLFALKILASFSRTYRLPGESYYNNQTFFEFREKLD